jgi:hypothetical protein
MNDGSSHNGNASAVAPPSARNSYDNLTEAEFLAHEAELAKTALGNTLGEIKADLAKAGNFKLWAHHYPWLTVGLAAATGFTLAAVAAGGGVGAERRGDEDASGANGSGREDPLRAGEEAERQRLLHETARAPYNTGGKSKQKLGDSLLGSLFSLARTALEASLVSAIREQGIQSQNQTNPATSPPPASAPHRAPSEDERVATSPQ